MRCLASIALSVGALIGLIATAAATTIPVSLSYNSGIVPGSPSLAFQLITTSFNLPVGFSNASLNLGTFNVDDRAVLELNGSIVASTGIYGPGLGSMVLTAGGTNDPFNFEYGNGGPFVPIAGPFVAGANSLVIVLNETRFGIQGDLNSTYPTETFAFMDGKVTYDIATTPLPAALPMFVGGVGLIGLLVGRRKRKTMAT
jgi:hypothetical protein